MNKYFFGVLFIGLCITACNRQSVQKTDNTIEQNIIEPVFDADSAYEYVARQVAFGPRVPNSQAHKQCENYLYSAIAQYADTVVKQNFTAKAYNGSLLEGCNIIASFNPQNANRILLAAHWDTRPFADYDADMANQRKAIDGANDGASGVGILLEIARQLHLQRPETGVDIIFFDIEDYGEPADERDIYFGENWCLGAQYWVKNTHVPYYHAHFGILLDMVGGKNAHFPKEGTSHYFASSIQDKIWNYAASLGFSQFTNDIAHAITDDHLYVNQQLKIQMVDIIDIDPYSPTGFNATWHTLNDNMENIDKQTLDKVGKLVMYTIRKE
ncbi:MAG: M28 family peptidase [Bacteroidales bacterium]|nr:M28 family peptidase [Bacteroidales bacterium]